MIVPIRLSISNAFLVEGGTSMFYFTGVSWGQSERPFAVVIPARGEFAWVCPGFEEARAREATGGVIAVGGLRGH